MKIGVIGSGHIGGTLTKVLAAAGHEVAVANSRGPESLGDLVAEAGSGAHAARDSCRIRLAQQTRCGVSSRGAHPQGTARFGTGEGAFAPFA